MNRRQHLELVRHRRRSGWRRRCAALARGSRFGPGFFPLRISTLLLLATFGFATGAAAHEVRPAFLQATEIAPGRFEVLWKLPLLGDRVLPLRPVLPEDCTSLSEPRVDNTDSALLERWVVDCGEGALREGTIAIENLQLTLADTLARVEYLDGTVVSRLLKPEAPSFDVGEGGGVAVSGYIRMGVQHILLGIDHLLFVLGLLLIVEGTWLLVKTITAFTVAHSITLALATFGVVNASPKAVETVVALSIVFLAAELVHKHRGQPGLTERSPWVVSFAFGLLHGLGFAGALTALGLPQAEVPMALLMFNVGVEIGQLLFVAVALVLLHLASRRFTLPAWAKPLPAYGIGVFASYWFLQRLFGILTQGI